MTSQPSLFSVAPRYCIDTNVIVSFLSRSDEEFYGSDVFAPQWAVFERLITNGEIIAPAEVRTELQKWAKKSEAIGRWLHAHNGMFRDPTTQQLALAKTIVNAYPAYGRDRHYLGDLMVITLAGVHDLTVITLERSDGSTPSRSRPKIPFACAEFGIRATGVPGFLRREQR
jgi:hypothetical protein